MSTKRNHEVTTSSRLLDHKGNIAEPGWSRKQLQYYDRADIKAPSYRIKEWDYYFVIGKDFGAAFTISDDGYIGLHSVSLLDFTKKKEHTETILQPFPMGKLHLPCSSSEGITEYHDKRLHMAFSLGKHSRRIRCSFKTFEDGKDFICDITLQQPPMDSIVTAIPFKKGGAFYYNQKINCMRASGTITYDSRIYELHPETDFGSLDWGRGVWTYNNVWYWGSGSCDLDGKPFGFNIGYGFGDTSAATENVIFYDGKAHKLDDVIFHIPLTSSGAYDFMSPWTFSSSDGRFEMNFVPELDRAARINAAIIETDQHQVFGILSGTTILDDGTPLSIQNMRCFAEWVHNRY